MADRPDSLPARRRRVLVGVALAIVAGMACASPPAADGTVLTVELPPASDGAARGRRDFDLAALATLPQTTIRATLPWYGAPRHFTGPLLRDVLAAAGAGAGARSLLALALGDYRAEIPIEDLQRWPVIVAYQVDGRPVAVRDKGPLMIVYPVDDDPELRQGRYLGRAVWQLRTIELR